MTEDERHRYLQVSLLDVEIRPADAAVFDPYDGVPVTRLLDLDGAQLGRFTDAGQDRRACLCWTWC